VRKTGKSKIEITDEALELYRFRERMQKFNDSYERLSANKEAWKQELKEREDLEGTLRDGFENECF
jgi:hypothetical protein